MSKNIVKPIGLKGQENINRIIKLMGNTVNESTKNSVVELSKIGPDGKVYGIVRENHNYYIKTVNSDKKSNLVVEDFQYCGGLQNKNKEAYPTYAKAIKQLNLKFLSLNESFGGSRVNVFKNDNLVTENVNDGSGVKTDKTTSGDNLDGEFDVDPKDCDSENTGKHKAGEKGHDTHIIGEDGSVELTEDEKLIDRMVEGKDPIVVKKKKSNVLKISRAINLEESDDKLNSLVNSLSPTEAVALIEALKKKV